MLAGLVLLVMGLLVAFGGGVLGFGGSQVSLEEVVTSLSTQIEITDDLRNAWDVLIGVAYFFLALGVIEALAGLLILFHKSVGRFFGILFGLAGTLFFGLIAVAIAQSGPVVQPDGSSVDISGSVVPFGVLTAIYLFVFLALAAGGKHFRRQRYE